MLIQKKNLLTQSPAAGRALSPGALALSPGARAQWTGEGKGGVPGPWGPQAPVPLAGSGVGRGAGGR